MGFFNFNSGSLSPDIFPSLKVVWGAIVAGTVQEQPAGSQCFVLPNGALWPSGAGLFYRRPCYKVVRDVFDRFDAESKPCALLVKGTPGIGKTFELIDFQLHIV